MQVDLQCSVNEPSKLLITYIMQATYSSITLILLLDHFENIVKEDGKGTFENDIPSIQGSDLH